MAAADELGGVDHADAEEVGDVGVAVVEPAAQDVRGAFGGRQPADQQVERVRGRLVPFGPGGDLLALVGGLGRPVTDRGLAPRSS